MLNNQDKEFLKFKYLEICKPVSTGYCMIRLNVVALDGFHRKCEPTNPKQINRTAIKYKQKKTDYLGRIAYSLFKATLQCVIKFESPM